MLDRKWYQASKPEMEFHIINLLYAALHRQKRRHFHAKTTAHWRSIYGTGHIPLCGIFYMYSVSLGKALTTAAEQPFLYTNSLLGYQWRQPQKWRQHLKWIYPKRIPPKKDLSEVKRTSKWRHTLRLHYDRCCTSSYLAISAWWTL